MSLNVTIPDTFNGPLGLLHSLIVRDEIDIYDIPIAKLTASYCEEIEKMEVINIDEGAEFLDLASRLKEIKLRMLLPPEEAIDGEEDEDDSFDPRSSLVEALLEYRRFKDAARILGDLADEQSRRHARIAPKMQFRIVHPEEDSDVDGVDLLLAMQNMLSRMSAPEVIESNEIPVATRIEQILEVIERRERTRFSLLLSTKPDRKEMVGFFVALLELIRRRLATARQTDDFSDIIIERRTRGAEEGGGPARRQRLRPGICFPEAGCMRAGCLRKKSGLERKTTRPALEAFPPVPSRKCRILVKAAARGSASLFPRMRKRYPVTVNRVFANSAARAPLFNRQKKGLFA